MCRHLLSVSHDGGVFDCDFNQALGLPLGGSPVDIWEISDFGDLVGAAVATATHCFGCTAGAGSSCAGALRADAGNPGPDPASESVRGR
jgi:hypothetical protein